MSIYYVSRYGTELGQFPESDLIQGMSYGQFFQEDLVWREGMADWQPLHSMFPESFATPPAAPPHLPLPLPPHASEPPLIQMDQTRRMPMQAHTFEPDFGMRMLLPVGRSGWAIAAGYLGLFGLVILPAPLALIVSIIAIRDIQKSKKIGKRKHGMGRAIFSLVVGIAGTLILIALTVAGMTAKES